MLVPNELQRYKVVDHGEQFHLVKDDSGTLFLVEEVGHYLSRLHSNIGRQYIKRGLHGFDDAFVRACIRIVEEYNAAGAMPPSSSCPDLNQAVSIVLYLAKQTITEE